MAVHPFLKQLFVASSPLLAALSVGGASIYPLVLLHQLKATDSTIHLDFDTASWVGSIHGIAGIPSIFMPTLMQWRGRKFAFIAACLVVLTGWIVAYTATSATAILVSESFHGFGSTSILAISYLTISEMVAPKYRDWMGQSYSVLQALGMAITTILTQYLHWRTISLLMCVPLLISVLMALAWPESPYWLAYKGKFDKSLKSFKWLRGNSNSSKIEFNRLFAVQRENLDEEEESELTSIMTFWRQVTGKDFYVPALLMITLQYTIYGTGGLVILIYSIDLVEKSTQNRYAASLGAIIMNSLLFVGNLSSLFLNRCMNKKTILLSSLVVIVLALSTATIVSYLQVIGYVSKDSIGCLICLIVFTLAAGIGVFPIVVTIATELMPVKHRGVGGGLLIINACVMHSFTLKISPYLFLYIDLWGTFLVFAITAVCCSFIIYKFVPQTSGRTLQEIENYYAYGEFDRVTSNDYENDDLVTEMEVVEPVSKSTDALGLI